MDRYKSLNLKGAITAMNVIQGDLNDATLTKTELQKRFDYLRYVLVPDKMEEEGIKTIAYDGIGRISITHDIRCSTPAANKEQMHQWLKDMDCADLIKPTVNASSLKALVKELIADGETLPEDMLTISPFARASITRS